MDFEKGYNTKSEKIRVQITDQIINWNPAQLIYPCKESREKARVTVDKLVGDNSKVADEEDDAQEDAPGGESAAMQPDIDDMTEPGGKMNMKS